MLRSSFRRLAADTINAVRKYPKLSFFAGGVAIATATILPLKYQKLDSGTPFFYPHLIPGFKLNKLPNQPVVNLVNLYESIQKSVQIKEFKATSPLYPKEERTYEGYDLLNILAALTIDPEKNDLMIFEAKDGFKSHIPLNLISKHHPMLAVRQKSAPEGQDWEMVDHPLNGKTDGGPFYLMWPENTGRDIVDNHWAFGVTKITFGTFQKVFGKIAPHGTKDPVINTGFKLFAQNCSCCHTFFQQGSANVGRPFEKIPAKYPSLGSIAAYAANPPPSSIMPKQELSLKQLEAVESYVRLKTQEGGSFK